MGKQADICAYPAKGRRLRLVILATTDLHAHLRPYNYYTDSDGDHPGLARVASVVDHLRAANLNCLLFDNGDTLQGSPLGDLFAEKPADGPHPMIAAMNALGFDAATVGNHDFNYGLEFLEKAVSDAAHPVLLANAKRPGGAPFLPGSAMLTREMLDEAGASVTLRIGVIGLTPPQVTKWDSALLTGQLETGPIVAAARSEAAALRSAGADLIIALCHSGAGAIEDAPDLENALLPLMQAEVADAIVAGHTHRLLPEAETSDSPVVQPGFFGGHLGQITLNLVQQDSKWHVAGAQSRLHAATGPDIPASPALMRLSDAAHQATLDHARRKIGAAERPMETYFALAGDSPTLALIAEAGRAHAARALQDHPLAHLPLLSVAAPFKAGGRGGPEAYTDIPAGPLSLRNAADLYPFPNALHVLRATGADLTDWLERSASAFNRIRPGEAGQTLLDPGFSGYNFDVIFGLTYQIDLSAPARYSAEGDRVFPGPGRIRDLAHHGQPVVLEDTFLVVTNSYRAAGGGHFAAPPRCAPVLAETTSVRDVVTRHIIEATPVSPQPQPTWRFAPLSGTEVIYETGAGALHHPDRIAELGLDLRGPGEDGFLRFALTL